MCGRNKGKYAEHLEQFTWGLDEFTSLPAKHPPLRVHGSSLLFSKRVKKAAYLHSREEFDNIQPRLDM